MDDELFVYLHERQVGSLTPTKKGSRFRFCPEMAEAFFAAPMLSTALLVQEEEFDSIATSNWFSGLLPESSRLAEVRRFFGIASNNYFDVLKEVGWECAGAVSVLPGRVEHFAQGDEGSYLEISSKDLSDRLKALPSHPYDNADTLRISLGGYQEKLCIASNAPVKMAKGYARLSKIEIPVDGAISTYILKPQPERFPGMIAGEAWAMAVASQVTETATAAMLELDDAPITLLVERFDREMRDGTLRRIHQEDCAQALGLAPGQKYAASGSPKKNDPSFARIAKLLKRYADDAAQQLEKLLQQMFVNVVLGNTDAHAKNYGLIHPDEFSIELSPLYDVVPALEITPNVKEMGLRIDGRIRIDGIGFDQVVNEAVSWGLPKARVQTILTDASERLHGGLDYASDLYPEVADRHKKEALGRLEAFVVE